MRDEFEPLFFFPSLEMFPSPNECPERVAKPIRSSFALFFADSSAAGNHVRQAVEEMLTSKGVRRFTTAKSGRRQQIPLVTRIADFAATNPTVSASDPLSALRWLGNAGSHPGGLSPEDVLDAYEILDDLLDQIYVGQKRALVKKTARIVKRRGPLARP
jgi:hypothetical protein